MAESVCKAAWQFLKNLNIHLPCNPLMALLGIYAREMKVYVGTCVLYMDVHSHFISNSPKLEEKKKSPSKGEFKQTLVRMVYPS